MSTPALACSGLTAGHTGAPVVRGLGLTVAAGEVLALLGPNGAGKTTTLMALAGLLDRREGTVSVGGRPLRSGRPRQAVKCGLVLETADRAVFLAHGEVVVVGSAADLLAHPEKTRAAYFGGTTAVA